MLNSSFDYISLLEEQSALLGNISSFPPLQDTHKWFQSFQDRDFKVPFQLKTTFTSLHGTLVTIWFLQFYFEEYGNLKLQGREYCWFFQQLEMKHVPGLNGSWLILVAILSVIILNAQEMSA